MVTQDRMDVTWDSDTGDGSDNSQDGIGLIRRSDYYHYQSDPAQVWNIEHNLNSFVIPQFYRRDASPANDREFFPVQVIAVDENNLRVTWDFVVEVMLILYRFQEKELFTHLILVMNLVLVYVRCSWILESGNRYKYNLESFY
jgi:hypothetical protein